MSTYSTSLGLIPTAYPLIRAAIQPARQTDMPAIQTTAQPHHTMPVHTRVHPPTTSHLDSHVCASYNPIRVLQWMNAIRQRKRPTGETQRRERIGRTQTDGRTERQPRCSVARTCVRVQAVCFYEP
uniref:Uncharacterized protein n=1 Tax=Vitrella brassicaformis TaxID=1169539 RepID=A0A7S1JVB9_9ALVE